MFEPNRYTQTAMPVCSELCRIITDELVQVSDDIMNIKKRNSADYENFYSSLSAEQKTLYEKHWKGLLEEYTAELTEHFNMGMYFGSKLAAELFKSSL